MINFPVKGGHGHWFYHLTSNVNSLFLAKFQFMRASEGRKEKLLTKIDEESSLVDNRFEISNLELIRDMDSIIKLEEVLFDLFY